MGEDYVDESESELIEIDVVEVSSSILQKVIHASLQAKEGVRVRVRTGICAEAEIRVEVEAGVEVEVGIGNEGGVGLGVGIGFTIRVEAGGVAFALGTRLGLESVLGL